MRKTRPDAEATATPAREYNYKWFANDLEEPYTTPDDKPFSWQGRMRVVGGRTNVWGRQSYRLSEQDFKGKSLRRLRRRLADRLQGPRALLRHRRGLRRDLGPARRRARSCPTASSMPPMAMTCAETQLRTRVKAKLGRTVTIGRTANLTKPINGRAACHYCGPCERGCIDALVLQLRVHDRRRRAEDGQRPRSSPTRWSTRC